MSGPGKKGANWNLSKGEKKQLSPLKGKDNVHVKLDKIQPQKGVRQTGINRAWREEKELVEKTGRGTRNWTKKQLKELKTKGRVTGFKGHHIVNVKSNADLAGDPRNIVFVNKKEHELVHGKNFRNDTQGRGIDRKAMIKQHESNMGIRKPIGEKIAEAEARALQRVKLRPEQAQQLTQKVEELGARLKPGLEKAQKFVKFVGIAEDVKEFLEADDKVMAGAKIIGKRAGARVGFALGGTVGAACGGVGAPIGAAAGYVGGEYAGEYLAEKGVNFVRKAKKKIMQVIGEETQEPAQENKPLELEVVKKVVVYYSSDEEIALPAFDGDFSDEDVPPPPKKKPLPKPAKPKQPKELPKEEEEEDEDVAAVLGEEDVFEEIEMIEEGGGILDQLQEEVGDELTEEDVEGVKAIFSEDLERDLFDVAEFVTDNFLPDNDTKKVVQGALDCYAFARGYKDITDPMAVAGALVNYLPPELQKIASPVLKGVRAVKTMTEMADKLQNGLDAIQLADVTDVLGLVAMIPGIPPEVSAVIGVISAAAKLASLLAAGTAPFLPVALAVASLLLALHKMFDLFSGLDLGGGGGDGDGDGDGDGGDNDGDNDGDDDPADADDAQQEAGQPDPAAQPGNGNAPGNAPGQMPGQQSGEGQGEAAGQQPPQGPHNPNEPRGQPANKQQNRPDQKNPNQPQQQQEDVPLNDQKLQHSEQQQPPNLPDDDQVPQQQEQQEQRERQHQPLNDEKPRQDKQPQPKPQLPQREADKAEAGQEQGQDKQERETGANKKERDLPRQDIDADRLNKKDRSADRQSKDGLEEQDDGVEGDEMDLAEDSASISDGEGEPMGSEEGLEDLLEGSELAPIDASELEDADPLKADSKKTEQKKAQDKNKPTEHEGDDGEGSADEDSSSDLPLSDFDGEEFDLEPFLTDGEKRKSNVKAKRGDAHGDSGDDNADDSSELDESEDLAQSGSEEGDGNSDIEAASMSSQDTVNADEGAEMDVENPTEFVKLKAEDNDETEDYSEDDNSFAEDLENELEADFTEDEIAEARERLKEAKEGVSSNATVWAKVDAVCQYLEEVDYVSAIVNDDMAFVAAQKQLLLAYTHYNAQRDQWLERERVQRRGAPKVKEITEEDEKDEDSEQGSEHEDSIEDIIDAAVNLLDESDLEELDDFNENDLSDEIGVSFGDVQQETADDSENLNLEHVGKIVGHRVIDEDSGNSKAIYRASAPKLKQRRYNPEEEPEGVIFKDNYDEHQHEFMKQVSEKAFYEARKTEAADKNSLSSAVVSKEKLFKQLISGDVPLALKSLLSDEQAQSLSSLTKGNAALSQAVLELLSDEISAVQHIELLIKFWKPLAKLFVISDGIFPQQFSELQPFMNKLTEVLASTEYQQFMKLVPDLEALAEKNSALKFDLDKQSEDEKTAVEKDNRDVAERILCKGMAASDEVATVNCLESPLDFQGIHYSDDISHILPIHALQLDNPDLEMMFWRDYTEKRLVTYEHDGGVIDDSNDDYAQMPKAKETLNYLVNERAPFIVCLNTPIKMEKKDELAVKLLVLNVFRQCLIEQRTAIVFGFTSKDQPSDVQKHVLTPSFDGLLALLEISQATFDRTESFHEVYAWNTCEHAPLHLGASYLKEMENKGQSLLAEVIIASRHITSLSWPYALLPSNGKLMVHLVEPKTINYCSAVLENDVFNVLIEPKAMTDVPVIVFIDAKSHLAQGVDHYRPEESEGKGVHYVFWDGSKTGEDSSVCLAFNRHCSFEFNGDIKLDQFVVKGASPFVSALGQQKTIANVEKSLVSLTTFGNSDEISISSNLLHATSLVSLPTVSFCCSLIHHVEVDELSAHPINSAVLQNHLELWLKADGGVSKPEWHWQDQSNKQRDVNDITEDNNQLPVLKYNEVNQQRYLQFTATTHYAVSELPEQVVEVFVVHEKQGSPMTLSREMVPFNALSVFPTAKVNCLNLQGEFINVYEIMVLRQGSPAECVETVTKYLKKKYNV